MDPDFMGVAQGETVDVSRDGRWYVARDEETGVASQGETVGDAIENLGEALDLHLDLAGGEPRNEPPEVPWFDGGDTTGDGDRSRARRSGRTTDHRTYSGDVVVAALSDRGFEPAGRAERHAKLRYRHPDGSARSVVVALFDDLAPGVSRALAEQAGAPDAGQFLAAVDRGR